MRSRRRPLADRAALVLSGAALLLAGAAVGAAATVRWWPCLTGAPAACVLAQDHSRDYDVVSAPFVPITAAVLLAALGTVATALLWAGWSRRAEGTARLLSGATAVLVALCGVGQVAAALSDGTIGVLPGGPGPAAWVALALQTLLTALPLASAVALLVRTRGATRVAWVVVGIGALAGFPVVEFAVLVPYSGSHDTPTGFGWVRAIGLLLGGASFVLAARRRPTAR